MTAPKKSDEAYLSQAEACELVGVSRPTFRAWGIEPVRKVGRSLVYRKSDVLRVSAEKRATSSQHRRGDSVKRPRSSRTAIVEEMLLDCACTTAYSSALTFAEYCRSIGRTWIDADFRLLEIAFAPQAVLESRGLPPKLPGVYVDAVLALVNAFRNGADLPNRCHTLPPGSALLTRIDETTPPAFAEVAPDHDQTDLLG